MHAAIIEFNSLSDADRAAADDYGFISLQRLGFIFLLVSAVKIGCLSIKLGGAGIHHFVDRPDIPFVPQLSDLFGQPVGQSADLNVRETQPFGIPHQFRSQGFMRAVVFPCR